MANPQLEDGFTQIPNELFTAIIKTEFSLRELKIILVVIRFTYGFHRTEAELSSRFLSNATKIKQNHIFEAVKNLLNKKILINKTVRSGSIRKYQLNKDYETWEFKNSRTSTSTELVLSNNPETVPVSSPEKVSNKENNKENKNILFENLWNTFDTTFGNKGSKIEALKQFYKLTPDQKLFDSMLEAIKNQIAYKTRLRNDGEFFERFPHVVRWLKNKRWDDVLATPQTKVKTKWKYENEQIQN